MALQNGCWCKLQARKFCRTKKRCFSGFARREYKQTSLGLPTWACGVCQMVDSFTSWRRLHSLKLIFNHSPVQFTKLPSGGFSFLTLPIKRQSAKVVQCYRYRNWLQDLKKEQPTEMSWTTRLPGTGQEDYTKPLCKEDCSLSIPL
ncbi:uncharacterized protein LOC127803590 [Diospyros lotus]|uniref:uncharacterized protein LOC127803590 n=1 Tax=Diospyros lotus TaxID=55363 RepID=UPI00224EC495|nr:uncharacterized protein LOC127803590 [Diospyros lotus]